MEMVRKEVSALRSKIKSYVATIRKQVSALVGELKVRMKSVVEYLKYLIKYIPGKLNELREKLVRKLLDTINMAKKMVADMREQIMSSKLYQQVAEYVKTMNVDIAEMKGKVVESLMMAQQTMEKEIVQMKEQLTVVVQNATLKVRTTVDMTVSEVPNIIRKVEKLVLDFLKDSEEFVKMTMVQVVDSEPVTQLLKIAEQLRDFVLGQVNQLINNPAMVQLRNRVEGLMKQAVYYTRRYIQVVQSEVSKMLSELKDLFDTTYVIILEILRRCESDRDEWTNENYESYHQGNSHNCPSTTRKTPIVV